MSCLASSIKQAVHSPIPVFCLFFLQWVVLTRKHAEVVVNDTTVFPMFQQHCKVMMLCDLFVPERQLLLMIGAEVCVTTLLVC